MTPTNPTPGSTRGGTDRRFPRQPVVGVGAVVLTDDRRVILVRRGHAPLAGRWSLPGGALELGETLRAGVGREVHEETGLDVEVGPVVDAVDHIDRESDGRVAFHYALVDFVCRVRGGELRAATDACDVVAADVDDLDAFELAATTRRVIARAVAMSRDASREMDD